MKQEVQRNYLEINSIQDLKKVDKPDEDYSLNLNTYVLTFSLET